MPENTRSDLEQAALDRICDVADEAGLPTTAAMLATIVDRGELDDEELARLAHIDAAWIERIWFDIIGPAVDDLQDACAALV